MNIVPFNFESHEVRVVTIDGEPHFVTADVLSILSLDRTALRRLDADEKGVASIHTLGGEQEVSIVNEPGLYSLILGSRKPQAKTFKRWVTHEVIPSIRKTGSYGAQAALTEDQIVHQAMLILTAKTAELEAKIEEDAPKVEYHDTFVADSDLRLLRTVAKDLGVQELALRQALIDHDWIYGETSERWSNTKRRKVPVTRYSVYHDKRDYFRAVPNHDVPRFRGEVMHTLKVTPEGAVAIARAVKRWGLAGESEVA